MGMSTHVVGFKPPDEIFLKMQKVWEACGDAGIAIPNEVMDFFGGVYHPDFTGVEVDLAKVLREWENEFSQGYELDVADIPKHVKTLRFYNTW